MKYVLTIRSVFRYTCNNEKVYFYQLEPPDSREVL